MNCFIKRSARASLLAALLAIFALTAGAQPATPDTAAPPVTSVEQADAILVESAAQSAAIEATFSTRQQQCYAKFFVNNCLDQAKEQRRAGLAKLRPLENAAKHFKRAYAVEQRELDMAERARKSDADAASRTLVPPKAEPAPIPAPAPGKTLSQRQSEHDAKVQRQQALDAAEAGQRAANVATFEQKQRDAAQRQSEIAAKQAAKEEQARKDAAAAAEPAK